MWPMGLLFIILNVMSILYVGYKFTLDNHTETNHDLNKHECAVCSEAEDLFYKRGILCKHIVCLLVTITRNHISLSYSLTLHAGLLQNSRIKK